ncbi:type II toxin-antitoxin system prevent-host-death family antitoxin [Mesorhizobium sp. BAC0120]|uniref:type II toxin-antitoxin system Phd/YefM family antitoxin n=1 Tax=Mesorhizobium sp. BAC0120 TaxID=3090670 RepID=UPI00298C763F|nr:type II toxin-antitoxin system prevent-host-death family antitoxin [Mesorhizobium sp. BAC0120]MDW6021773.1 type II toxin-antitoxin system prevent-host-death family antitoxin [Mesorhizobium sp. BAC0120]
MDETISAAEANREFSRLLREVREGKSYVVTSHGRPVAKLVPIDADKSSREKAKQELLAELRTRPIVNVGPWTRDELYDD